MAHVNTKNAEEENKTNTNTLAGDMHPEARAPMCDTHCAVLAANTPCTTLPTSRRQYARHAKAPNGQRTQLECHKKENTIGEHGIQLTGHLVGGSQCFGADGQGERQEPWPVYKQHARLTHTNPQNNNNSALAVNHGEPGGFKLRSVKCKCGHEDSTMAISEFPWP